MRELIFLATGAIIGGVITMLRNDRDDLEKQVEHERRARQEASAQAQRNKAQAGEAA